MAIQDCNTERPNPPQPPVADGVLAVVDQFEILKALGAGGFGTVYLAQDTTSRIEVALKVIGTDRKSAFCSFGWKTLPRGTVRADTLEDELRENFKLIHGLRHDHIAVSHPLHLVKDVKHAVDGVAIAPGDILSVMAYAPGVTLDKWRMSCDGGRVPERLAVDIVSQVASALDYAHGKRVIHRDVKPSNIMVETRGDGRPFVQLLDFGLAAADGGRGVCGTPQYMSPEQWSGGTQDKRTDQYSLAVLTCELLTGHVPHEEVFRREDREAIRTAVLSLKPEFPRGLSARRRRAIARAMAKLPAGRYASCGEFVAALTPHPLIAVVKWIVVAAFVLFGLVWFTGERQRGSSNPESKPVPVPIRPALSVHRHSFCEWRTECEAHCESAGRQTRTCQAEGCTVPPMMDTRDIRPLGHDWGEWSVAVPPQTDSAGERRRVCRRCRKEERRQMDPLAVPQPPALQIRATLNGREVSGAFAQAHFGNKFRLPGSLRELKTNDRIREHFVSYYDRDTGRSYRGWFGMDVDWTGTRRIVVELEEGRVDDDYVRHGYRRRKPWRETTDDFPGDAVSSDE